MPADTASRLPNPPIAEPSDPPRAPRRPVFAPLQAAAPNEMRRHNRDACQWIEGEPRGADTAFCGAPSLAHQPWCARHRRIAYLAPASEEAKRAIARFALLAKNRQIGRDAAYYVDRDFDPAPAEFLPPAGAGRARTGVAP